MPELPDREAHPRHAAGSTRLREPRPARPPSRSRHCRAAASSLASVPPTWRDVTASSSNRMSQSRSMFHSGHHRLPRRKRAAPSANWSRTNRLMSRPTPGSGSARSIPRHPVVPPLRGASGPHPGQRHFLSGGCARGGSSGQVDALDSALNVKVIADVPAMRISSSWPASRPCRVSRVSMPARMAPLASCSALTSPWEIVRSAPSAVSPAAARTQRWSPSASVRTRGESGAAARCG